MEKLTQPENTQSRILYAAPDTFNAGFSMGQPVLDIHMDREYMGCLFQSYRNDDRRLRETWQFHDTGGNTRSPKFDTMAELILWTQSYLIGIDLS